MSGEIDTVSLPAGMLARLRAHDETAIAEAKGICDELYLYDHILCAPSLPEDVTLTELEQLGVIKAVTVHINHK